MNFRYGMIHEFGTSQAVSQTSDVIIYNIKGANGFPPVQIIDTSNFWDN